MCSAEIGNQPTTANLGASQNRSDLNKLRPLIQGSNTLLREINLMPFQNHAGLLRRIGDPPSTVCSPFAKPQVGSPPVARKGVYGRTFLIYRSKPAWFWGAGEGRFAIGPDNGTGGARKTLLNGVRRVPRAKSAGVRAVRGPGAPRVGAVPSAPALAKAFFQNCPCIAVRVPV